MKLVEGNRIINTRFFGAGKAIFTIHSPSEHYTYKIQQKDADPKKDEEQEKMPFFIYLLTGSDNYHNYTYMGMYNPCFNNVRLTTKSKYREDSKPFKVVVWGLKMVERGNWDDPKVAGYDVKSEGKCARCGRRLTTPESVELGIGPDCINYL